MKAPKFQCYIAQSIDGYIARKDGNLDWLTSLPVPEGEDYGYGAFYAGIDVVVMGRSTYQEILGFDVPWPYENCKCFVLTSQASLETPTPNTQVIKEVSPETTALIVQASTKNIWIVGGGAVVSSFIQANALDQLILCTIPTVLGEGIPLFPEGTNETSFTLTDCKSYSSGAIMAWYDLDKK